MITQVFDHKNRFTGLTAKIDNITDAVSVLKWADMVTETPMIGKIRPGLIEVYSRQGLLLYSFREVS